jgi:hypothetical protein
MTSALHLMFVAMSQDQLVDAISLSITCETDVFDGKDCFELGLQIFRVLHNDSSGTLRDTIQQLFCSRQITRLSTISPPDVFPIDILSSDTHPFPDPLLGSNVWILASGLFSVMLNHLKHSKISFGHFPCSSSWVLFATYGQTIIWWNIVAVLPFRLCLIWLHTPSWQKSATLVNWLSTFLTRQSREWLKSFHDVRHNIRPTDSIEWHWGRGCWRVGSTPRQLLETEGSSQPPLSCSVWHPIKQMVR